MELGLDEGTDLGTLIDHSWFLAARQFYVGVVDSRAYCEYCAEVRPIS